MPKFNFLIIVKNTGAFRKTQFTL